jgi:TRAP transporter T-component
MRSAPALASLRLIGRLCCPLFALAGLLWGCSASKFAADTTAGFLSDAAPAARAYFDYETAGYGAANGLLQLEGLHHVSPNNERLTLLLAQAYVAYAFGWVMDRQEEEQFAGRYEQADREKQRAYLMYQRAHDLTLRLLHARDPEIDSFLFGDPDKLAARLRERFNRRDRDVELVFWSALAWGSTITNAPGLDALVDLPAVKVLALHSVALDEAYEGAGALALLGGFEASYPQQLGGNWPKGRAYFERALRLSRRHNHMHHINFARTYAVNAQDKALFVSLLKEVLEAGDQGNDNRLSNKVARRRAERYLSHIDDYFE